MTTTPAEGTGPRGRQLHLAARFPGADDPTVWSEPSARRRATTPARDTPRRPRAGSPTDFASFEHLARTAERGLFDFLLVAEELGLREHQGRIHDLDVAGGPEVLTVLSALAAVTDRLGLAGSVSATFNEPFELARRIATLDHVSAGRAAWNVVTSSDARSGENFRRGGHPDGAGLRHVPGPSLTRGSRVAEFVATARELWDSWTPEGEQRPFAHRGRHFDIAGRFTVPRPPQGHPVVIQADGPAGGREFAAATADVVLTRHGTLEAGREFYAGVKGRLARYGRSPEDLKIMSGATVVLGDSAEDAQERAAAIRRQQISPQRAIHALEQVWGVDLSSYDPDGPLPSFDPDPRSAPAGGTGHTDPAAVAAAWRALSEGKGLSIRETVIETTGRQSFVGTPESVAARMSEFVAAGATDGFILIPQFTPSGLDEFVARVVPLLQERGSFRTGYSGTTLRSHLGLSDPVWKG